jgi:hypothetical protein
LARASRNAQRPEWTLIKTTLSHYLEHPEPRAATRALLETCVPGEQQNNLDALLGAKSLSYREMAVIQLAFLLCSFGIDPTRRPDGARSVGARLGDFLAANHIRGTADAYQNTGKNDDNLIRGNLPASDHFLQWTKQASSDMLKACFHYLCAELASMARPVAAMPTLNLANLTFGQVMGLFVDLLALPSEGAYQQYMVAALLDVFQQFAHTGYYVETKPLRVSDKSAKTAGDVVLAAGSKVQEAYEVTARDWRTKTSGASQKMREYSLKAMHIVAAVDDYAAMTTDVAAVAGDLSVVDLHGFAATLLSLMPKTYRTLVLERLYEYLDGYGQNTDRVNEYVAMLVSRGLGMAE